MKMITYIWIVILSVAVFSSCDDSFDSISRVDPGTDERAPVVTMTMPTEGMELNAQFDVSEVDIQFEVTDDIELEMVELELDGSSLTSFNSFSDYRRLVVDYPQTMGLGEHMLVIKATDKAGKNTTQTINFTKVNTIRDLMAEALFYMNFNEDYTENVGKTDATVVGTPSFEANGVDSSAYQGAAESYLTFPASDLQFTEFSASCFLKINAIPDRAGILVMGPEDPEKPDTPNNRRNGFRFFREAAGSMQRLKLNVGNGEADSWFDGGAAADVDPSSGAWIHAAFTISASECIVYINGAVVAQGAFTGVDWTGCDILSIMSGAPRFTEWNHLSDESLMDELLIYDRVLTPEEIQLLGLLKN